MWPEISASLLEFVSHACEHEISLSEIYLAHFLAVSKANNIFEHTRGRSNMSAVFQWQLFDAATIHNLYETHKSLLANMFTTSYPPHPGSFTAVHTWKSITTRFLTVFLARSFSLCILFMRWLLCPALCHFVVFAWSWPSDCFWVFLYHSFCFHDFRNILLQHNGSERMFPLCCINWGPYIRFKAYLCEWSRRTARSHSYTVGGPLTWNKLPHIVIHLPFIHPHSKTRKGFICAIRSLLQNLATICSDI